MLGQPGWFNVAPWVRTSFCVQSRFKNSSASPQIRAALRVDGNRVNPMPDLGPDGTLVTATSPGRCDDRDRANPSLSLNPPMSLAS